MEVLKKIRKTYRKIICLIKLRNEINKKRKLNVGSGNVPFDNNWFSCDIHTLDITKRKDWYKLLGFNKLTNIFAEHVWEHLDEKDTMLANKNCYKFLKKNGNLRIAVPDGYHPNKNYINHVKPNGNGPGANDHKVLYNYSLMKARLEKVGFKVKLLEYWDENGYFHFNEWTCDGGKVIRSKSYDIRNLNGDLNYTSLIVDAFK